MTIIRPNYRELAILISVSITILLLGSLLIINRFVHRDFNWENFEIESEQIFAHSDLSELALQAQLFYSQLRPDITEDLSLQFHQILRDFPPYNLRRLHSSTQQIRAMSLFAHQFHQEHFPDDSFYFIDRIYGRDITLSALLRAPQAYLFILTPQHQEKLSLLVLEPSIIQYSGYKIIHHWIFYNDAMPSETFLSNLFLIFHHNIR